MSAAAVMDGFVHVACPACLKANRIPAARRGDGPKCGGCGTPLLDGKPVALDERDFDAFIGRTDLPLVVDFWAPWCAPCRAMAPAFEAAAAELATRARFAKLNTEEAQAIAVRFGIRSIPTLALFRDGREVDRISGAMDARALARWVAERI
jgi:thioredoxin 2